jgi:ferredoxin-NADP reductase
MSAAVFRSHLTGQTPRVADVVTFQFEKPAGFEYEAGQWFVITLPEFKEPLFHHFSFSCSPEDQWLEFTTRIRGSEFKTALRGLPIGAEVELEGPYGAFVLPPGREAAVFLAAGIGITCVRSILRSLAARPEATPTREIVLIFANRLEEAIPFAEELGEMETTLPNFRVVHVLSQPGEGWAGHRGHVSEEILRLELPAPERWTYYTSGPPGFVGVMREMLATMGIESERVKMERFEGYL